MTLYDDNMVWATAAAMAACLCAQIEDPQNGVPGVCFCGVFPGESVVAQYIGECDDCGMGWVRVASIYPAKVVGVPNTDLGNCGSGLGIELELGILRCMTVGDEHGNPPSAQELADATQLQIADALLIHRAVLCCDALDPKSMIVGPYVPTGPQGGVVGGTIRVVTAV